MTYFLKYTYSLLRFSLVIILVVIAENLLLTPRIFAQQTTPAPPKSTDKADWRFALNDDGSHYIRLTFANQTWVRWNESNPGTTVFGTPKSATFDIGLRRTRFQLFGQLTDRIFFYAQFGQNNFNYISPRKLGAFFHDVTGEYAFIKKHLTIGGGLSGWSGPARFASPSIASVMPMDAPIFEQATNDINDQFLRKLSIYAKGKLGKLDYRLALSNPFMIDPALFTVLPNSPLPVPTLGASPSSGGRADNAATFALRPPNVQLQGYFMYQFLDQETNQVPYTQGTYLGQKKVFNIGAGFVHQANAIWYRNNNGADTTFNAMTLLSVDVFYDTYLNKEKGTALNAYLAYFDNNFGPNYIRNLGLMNPANGVAAGKGSFAGAGNAFPIEGTGNLWYGQIGYKFKDKLLGEQGTLMPYSSLQYANYQGLRDKMYVWNIGINWLIKGHNSKITLNYENRPVFSNAVNSGTIYNSGSVTEIGRRGCFTIQHQIFF